MLELDIMKKIKKNKFYKEILVNLEQGVLVLDRKYKITFVNDHFKNIFNFEEDDLISNHSKIKILENKIFNYNSFLHQLGKIEEMTKKKIIYLNNGTTLFVTYKELIIKDKYQGVICFFEENELSSEIPELISEKNQMSKGLIGDIILINSKGKIIHGDKRIIEILGYNNLNNFNFDTLNNCKDLRDMKEKLNKVDNLIDKLIIEKDKQILNIKVEIKKVENDSDDLKCYILKCVNDSRDLNYKMLIEAVVDPIILYKDNELYLANDAVLQLFNYNNLSEFNNKIKVKLNMYLKDKQNFIKGIEELFCERNSLEFKEYQFNLDNNQSIDVEIGAFTFQYNNSEYVNLIIRDIYQRKKIERLQDEVLNKELELQEIKKHEELRTIFFANISHELRTPLNIILGGLQMLDTFYTKDLAEVPNKSVIKYIKMMRQNCYRLLRIINSLIDITKLDSDFLKLNLINCNIVSLIEDIVLSVADYAKNQRINIIFDTEIKEQVLACDPDKIERIILNLLSNAIKFTPEEGDIYVKISAQEEKIYISIKDTGIGIPSDELSEIFIRFKQVEETSQRDNEGSGIGLSLVKELVNKHQGEINVESSYGQGTEFTIMLPIYHVSDSSQKLGAKEHQVKGDIMERINIEFADIYSTSLFN